MKTIKEIEHLESKYAMDKVFSEGAKMKTIKELIQLKLADNTDYHVGCWDALQHVLKLIDELRTGCTCGRCTVVLKELKARITG